MCLIAFVGLKAFTYVVQQDANLALQHQMTIIECLDHSDIIIKREVRLSVSHANMFTNNKGGEGRDVRGETEGEVRLLLF